MDSLSRLTAAVLLALAGTTAQAGYALATPPAGFSQVPGTPGSYTYAPASNSAWVNGTARSNVLVNVGGRSVTMPASMRLASNAPRFIGNLLLMNPYLRGAAAFAAWLGVAKLVWDEGSQMWKQQGGQTTYMQEGTNATCDDINAGSKQQWGDMYEGSVIIYDPNTGYDMCYYKYAGGRLGGGVRMIKTVADKPLTTAEAQNLLNPEIVNPSGPVIMPAEAPMALPPGTALPVEAPVINPSADPVPAPLPYFVPLGDPVPNPNYDPQQAPSPSNQPYITPGIRIVPSPTPAEPMRVDIQPVNRPSASLTPLTNEQLNPTPQPNTPPTTQPADQPKPQEQQDVCEKHPEILACQNLDEVKPEPLATEEVNIQIRPVAGFGPDVAQCPAPMAATIAGKPIEFSWAPVCSFAAGLRPIVIALAWLSAASMLVFASRKTA